MSAPVDPQPGPDFVHAREAAIRIRRHGDYDPVVRFDAEIVRAALLTAESDLLRAAETEKQLREGLEKINEIRNSIVGHQDVNWSEHIYPLVAALNASGMIGEGYDKAKPRFASLHERLARAEQDAGRFELIVDWLDALPDDYCLAIWRHRLVTGDPEADPSMVEVRLCAGNRGEGREDSFQGEGNSIPKAFRSACDSMTDAARAGASPHAEQEGQP